MFVHCLYVVEVWSKSLLLSNCDNKWKKHSLLSSFKSWEWIQICKSSHNPSLFCSIGSMDLIKNCMTFQGKCIQTTQVAHQIRYTYRESGKDERVKPSQILKSQYERFKPSQILKSQCMINRRFWAFFASV